MSAKMKVCKNGTTCAHLKTNSCKFYHEAPPAKAKQNKNDKKVDVKGLHAMLAPHREAMGRLFAKKEALMMTKVRILAAPAPGAPTAGWFGDSKDSKAPIVVADTKTVDAEIAQVTAELALLRTTARAAMAGFGAQMLKIKLYTTFNAPVSSSQVSSVFAVDPTVASEFASLAALFDEYKVVGGHIDYVTNLVVDGNSATAAATDRRLVIAYDPADGAAITVPSTAQQLVQHQLIFVAGGFSTAPVATRVQTENDHHRFEFHVPKGVLEVANQSSIGGAWQPTNPPTSYLPYGYIKLCTGASIGNANQPTGVQCNVITHCEFRCRQ
jgi:hypothetical protein